MLDHATGYLMAFGAMMAKARQAREGGSWHVRVSLARTGQWLWNLGRVADGFETEDLKGDAVTPFVEEVSSGFGPLRSVSHSAVLSKTPAFWPARRCRSAVTRRNGRCVSKESHAPTRSILSASRSAIIFWKSARSILRDAPFEPEVSRFD